MPSQYRPGLDGTAREAASGAAIRNTPAIYVETRRGVDPGT